MYIYVYIVYTCIICMCVCVYMYVHLWCGYISFGRYERSLHGAVIKHKRRKNGEEQGDRYVTIIGRLVKATGAATGAERPRRNSISHSGLFSVRVVTCPAPGSGRLFLKPGRSA